MRDFWRAITWKPYPELPGYYGVLVAIGPLIILLGLSDLRGWLVAVAVLAGLAASFVSIYLAGRIGMRPEALWDSLLYLGLFSIFGAWLRWNTSLLRVAILAGLWILLVFLLASRYNDDLHRGPDTDNRRSH